MPAKEALSNGPLCRFGIVAALPKEFAAVRAMLDAPEIRSIEGDPNDYLIGSIPSADASGVHHVVVTLLKKTGNNSAAAAASHLIRSFATVTDVLMVGIAGGVQYLGFASREPAPEEIQAADDDRKHVVEVVGKASGELTHRLHLLRLA